MGQEANDALLAALLAQEDGPYFEDGDVYNEGTGWQPGKTEAAEDSDDDYDPSGRRGGGGGASRKRGRKRKAATSAGGDKKRTKGTKGCFTRRTWSSEEERLFKEGLDKFGRDWRKTAELIKTRDKDSVRSHAQRWFAQLWYDGKELPAKVQESGPGHTLSGKLFDPESGYAKKFLQGKPKRKPKFEIPKPEDRTQPTKPRKKRALVYRVANGQAGNSPDPLGGQPPPQQNPSKPPPPPPEPIPPPPPAPRRRRTRQPRNAANISRQKLCSDILCGEPLTLHKCLTWRNVSRGKQPFRVVVSPFATSMADFHSHMLEKIEVIGLLIGTYDEKKKVMKILCSRPGKSVCGDGSDVEVNVELDPTSEIECREWIKTKEAREFCGVSESEELQVVGWYHSHPVFEPIPSTTDIRNHRSYQHALFKGANGTAPFVALIVGPWDTRMLQERSVHQWFSIEPDVVFGDEPLGLPVSISVEVESTSSHAVGGGPLAALTIPVPTPNLAQRVESLKAHMVEVLGWYLNHEGKSDFAGTWRGFSYGPDRSRVLKNVTRLMKLQSSVRHLLTPLGSNVAEAVVKDLAKTLVPSEPPNKSEPAPSKTPCKPPATSKPPPATKV